MESVGDAAVEAAAVEAATIGAVPRDDGVLLGLRPYSAPMFSSLSGVGGQGSMKA